MKEITKEEYVEWLKSADTISDEYPIFTSCCGPHEFSRDIVKDGILYYLTWGWGWKENKEECNYRIECAYKLQGQEGDGI